MPKWTPPPAPSPPNRWDRFWGWVSSALKHPIIAGVIVVVIAAAIGLEKLGSGSDSDPPAAQAGATSVEAPEPKSAAEQVAQRPYWINSPETFDDFDGYGAWNVAAVTEAPDLLVGRAREVFEDPGSYAEKAFFVVGRVRTQQSVDGPYFEREYRLDSGEPGFDFYVASDDSVSEAEDGEVVTVFGRLAAVGETRAPGLSAQKSVYVFTSLSDVGAAMENAEFSLTTSGTLKSAIKRVTAATR